MKRNNKGQEAIEFILICTLVFFGGLFAIMTFGSKMASFFATDSSVAQAANKKANVISASTTPDFKTTLTTKVDDEERTTIDSYEALKNADGSISVVINGQTINLEPSDLNLVDTVFETTGSSGTELINAIAKMIEEYKVAGGPDIPIEISFGTGSRTGSDGVNSSTYEGTASVNTIVVKSNDNITVIQKDQTCVNAKGTSCLFQGTYTIQGKIGSDGSFNTTSVKASIDEGSLAGQTLNGSYNATAKTSSGLSLSGTYNIFYSNLTTPPYQWDINFSSLKTL